MTCVEKVRSLRQLRQFLSVTEAVYPCGSAWVPPLRLQTLLMLGGPWDSKRSLLIALEGRTVVGRIAVRQHRYPDGTEALHFGFFECLDHPEAAQALVEAAHSVAPHLPLRGPYHFTMEEPYTGLLVEGFDEPPYFWTAYNPAYYVGLLEAAGFEKLLDLWSYQLNWQILRSKAVERRAQYASRQGVTVRPLRRKGRWRDVRRVAEVMNGALQNNWGFEPFTEAQVRDLTLLSYLFLDPDWLMIAEKDGRPVGASIVLPNFNPWLKGAGGRLSPLLLWRLLTQKTELPSIRAWALGVLAEDRPSGAGLALIWACIERARKLGVSEAEVSWVLENNPVMNGILTNMGGRRSKVHRILERS